MTRANKKTRTPSKQRNFAFVKMEGASNDFILIDWRRMKSGTVRPSWRSVSQYLCDRNIGVGADGVLVLETSTSANVRMRIFNPDGSEAEMCGNGLRCVARYLFDEKKPKVRTKDLVKIQTRSGILEAWMKGDSICVSMPQPQILEDGLQLMVGSHNIRLTSLNTGVPHAVMNVNSLQEIDVDGIGQAIRGHRHFAPQGTNVDFIQLLSGHNARLQIRTYERGVEHETFACGTGVTAGALAYAWTKDASRQSAIYASRNARALSSAPRKYRVEVVTRSGDLLSVSCLVDGFGSQRHINNVVLEGPARRVFDGNILWPMTRGRGVK